MSGLDSPIRDGDLAGAAACYAGLGWPVFPLRPREKVPLFPRAHPPGSTCEGACGQVGHGFYDATTSSDLILKWWTETPRANIGIRTGLQFDVLDIDSASAEALLAQMGNETEALPRPVARTGSGGSHHFFRATGLGNRVGITTKVDWRGAGGYVVAAPSVHPNGGHYKWITPPTTEVPTVPHWLLDLLRPTRSSAGTRAETQGPDRRRPYGSYGIRAIQLEADLVRRAPVGQRNDTLNRAAFQLGTLAESGGVNLSTVVASLVEAALASGLTDREIRGTIKSGLRAGLSKPRPPRR